MYRPPALVFSFLPIFASATLISSNSTNTTLVAPFFNISTVTVQLSPGTLFLNGSQLSNVTLAPITQQIAYYVEENVAIIDGDVNFGSEAELLAYAISSNHRRDENSAHPKRSLSLFPTDTNRWPNGVVRYKWESQTAKDARIVDWTEAMKRWTDRLPFLKFVDTGVLDATLVAGVITLRHRTGTGSCTSPIGMATNVNGNFIKLDDCGPGGYAHEIGHTLGLYHEQQRPDRDAYMTLHCSNIANDENGNPPACGTPCAALGCNFRKLGFTEADWAGPYDVLSLMHYHEYEFSKNGQKTLEPLPGVPSPQPHQFPTLTDARRVCDVYWEVCRGVCGDGIFSPNNGEQCDDGNNIDGDGCSAGCKKELPKSCPVLSCDPTVGLNKCDVSTSCISLAGATMAGVGKFMCACRHGFRADAAAPGDKNVQVRLPWTGQEGRVFVRPGVACNQLCDQWQLGKNGCTEVVEEPLCF